MAQKYRKRIQTIKCFQDFTKKLHLLSFLQLQLTDIRNQYIYGICNISLQLNLTSKNRNVFFL
jgi:hypothetical protein